MKAVKNIKYIIPIIIILLSIYINKYNGFTFDSLIFSLIYSEGSDTSVFIDGIKYILFYLIILISLFFLFKYILKKLNKEININKKIILYGAYFISIIILLFTLKVDEYIYYNLFESNFIKENYINPKEVNITFPKEKPNLIYIYLESMENSALSKENGGMIYKTYIPELEQLALNNLNFSNTDKLGGMYEVYGANYTTASIVAQTSALPLKMPINYIFKSEIKFMPGAYTLGEILEKEGYNNYFMVGSIIEFGGLKDYLSLHGNYKFYDYNWAINEGLINKDYKQWWGFEDKKLFAYAKQELLKISKENKPFNFTMTTLDTHFNDGYLDETCKDNIFEKQYENVFKCSSNMLNEFINWIKEQEFYQNTVIILVGDHNLMAKTILNDKNYDKTIYNVIINSKQIPTNNKNRLFTAYDMFPTTLAALNIEIENNKLALGTNLFSNEKTLLEQYNLKQINKELKKHSSFYNEYILK